MDLSGAPIDGAELARRIKDRGPLSLRHIIAKSDLASSPANRMFDVFENESRAQARSLLRLRTAPPAFWEAHMLDPSVLDDARADECLQSRQRHMIAMERAFLTELDLRAYPTDAPPADAPIDTDDE